MGMGSASQEPYDNFSKSVADSESCNGVNINPDPSNYKIEKSHQRGTYLAVWIYYPNCTNFEGRKILVFRDVTLKQLLAQKLIDPHFSDSKQFHHPIARFIPNHEGWLMALAVCKMFECE
jgi:hypothetical protein